MNTMLLGAWKTALRFFRTIFNEVGFYLVRKLLWRFRRPRYFILLGPPGSGKGTLATQLAPALRVPPMSTGDVFRREKAANTDFGKQVTAHLADGNPRSRLTHTRNRPQRTDSSTLLVWCDGRRFSSDRASGD